MVVFQNRLHDREVRPTPVPAKVHLESFVLHLTNTSPFYCTKLGIYIERDRQTRFTFSFFPSV